MANSNKEIHKEYQRVWKNNRRLSYFKDKSCVKCGSTDRMELDHIDPSLKIDHKIWSWSDKRREEEISKCQVLCYTCHKEKTKSKFPEPEHGTQARYKWNRNPCRCDLCKHAHTLNIRRQRLNRKMSHSTSSEVTRLSI